MIRIMTVTVSSSSLGAGARERVCRVYHLFIVTSAVQFSDAFLSCLQVLASSQTDVGARESKSRSEGKEKEGSAALGLTAVRRAMVEWSINLGGDVSYSPLLVSLLSSPLLSYSILSSPLLSFFALSYLSCPIISSLLLSSLLVSPVLLSFLSSALLYSLLSPLD